MGTKGLGIYKDNQWIPIGAGQVAITTFGHIDWIYVGTPGVDGIDTKLANNFHPYATGDTPGPIPFTNGTTVPANPLAFGIFDTVLLLSGGFTGQTINQAIFTLPVGFRPVSDQPIGFMWSDFSKQAGALVQSSGVVLYKGSAAITLI